MQEYATIYKEIASKATYGQIEQASKWYLEAERVAEKVATNLNISLENAASIVSAFSPRERWTANVAKSIAFSLGETPVGLSNNLRMARAAISIGFDALKGPKTNAFARAIAGDENAVVIDVWMMRALGLEKKSPTKEQYKTIARAVRTVATLYGMTPRAMQALIWIIVRGSAE
jgi:hypothetical protein